ncbi:sarcosine oxidase subunit delta [Frigidibacter sp. RF13]|uniref:sarcosine oxidase subunit delta n=1 Tax=Frigidibacter sp. RF13 TaxID=2997340 RepID=UPI00226DCE42|nr:sarcosine oxidase subunit delta [Frigidibacter sp. RF13]MCY1127266.1 sarcosine oxidase subunit delta [Frigidibacter sp. RF13]
MRITCPLCGTRDRREFTYYGARDYLNRPGAEAAPEAWDDYLHLRDNPAGRTEDLWYHEQGCAAWLCIERDTVTHEIFAVRLVADQSGTSKTGAKKPRRKPAGKAAEGQA